MPSPLNSMGLPNTRNYDKPNRPQRVIKNEDGTFSQHPLDAMGRVIRAPNTTGCHGKVSQWNVRVSTVDTRGLPGHQRRRGKKKGLAKGHICHTLPKVIAPLYERELIRKSIETRGKLHTKILCEIATSLDQEEFKRLTRFLVEHLSLAECEQLDRQDSSRVRSVKGNLKK